MVGHPIKLDIYLRDLIPHTVSRPSSVARRYN
jgi:hypothetical protein